MSKLVTNITEVGFHVNLDMLKTVLGLNPIVMLDIETTGRDTKSVPWQIAFAVWNPSDQGIITTHQLTFNPWLKDTGYYHEDKATIEWQEDNNRFNWMSARAMDRMTAFEIVHGITQLFSRTQQSTNHNRLSTYWSKSINFDFPILTEFVNRLPSEDVKFPWQYYNVHELRTFMLLNKIPNDRSKIIHEAADDAKKQLLLILKEFGDV